MPEYRRFVAYFYEYINGKKQKNSGFAKVELRNGMWRILFRLTTDIQPEPPVQVFGFVREKGYLLGLPFGTMRPGREISEEWAYRSDHSFGSGKYRFGNLAGIWIQSGDGRSFITVWDDETADTERFVLELPQKDAEMSEKQMPVSADRKTDENMEKQRISEKVQQENAGKENTGQENTGEETTGNENTGQENIDLMQTDAETEETDTAYLKASEMQENPEVSDRQVAAASGNPEVTAQRQIITQPEKPETVVKETVKQQNKNKSGDCVEELLQKRQHFQPFEDQEIADCVQIMPCDILRLQQENWRVGRSSFLQHGYYQYRHLLMGRSSDGAYIIGVPGMRNQQEYYMAKMFGFDRFKMSRICDCGRAFGYWCRTLQRE